MEVRVRKRSIVIAALAIAMSAVPLSALQTPAPPPNNVTGTWSGKVAATGDGEPKEEGIYAVLKQEGATITGTIGPRADRQQDIANAKLVTTKEGTTLTLDTGRPGHVIHFTLKLGTDALTGSATDELYPQRKITVDLKKEKAK